MRKSNFLIVGLLLISLGLFSGCQGARNNNEYKKMTWSQDKRMGTIQSLGGAPVSNQATHLLRLDNGKTLFLKSAVLDLSSAKYTGKEVEVGGNILRTTDGNEVMDVMNIDLVDRDVNVAEDLPQWMDYSSENLQVGLKYRDDYKLQENSEGLTLTKTEKPISGDAISTTATTAVKTNTNGTTTTLEKKAATISIKVISRENDYNLLEMMGVTSDSSTDLLAKGYNKSKITQKALDAYKQAKSDGTEISYIIKSGYSYQLKFTAGDSSTLVIDQNMFYDLLASINFGANLGNSVSTNATTTKDVPSDTPNPSSSVTDSTNTALDGFQSFTSEAMKFSVQYPKGYYFGNTVSKTPSAVRTYAFSTKPADDESGELIILDIIKGSMPEGSEMDLGNGKMGVVTKSGSSVIVAVDWGNGQFFQLSGPGDKQTVMKQMASSIIF